MERTIIHNIQICVGEGCDDTFAGFIHKHSVLLEPGGNAEEAQAEGERFAHFLAEFCNPSWLKGLSDALPARSPWCMVWGLEDDLPYYITSFRIESIPHGSIPQAEIEGRIKPLRKDFDSLLVIAVGSEKDGETGIPHFWCWRLSPRKPSPAFDWEREQIQ